MLSINATNVFVAMTTCAKVRRELIGKPRVGGHDAPTLSQEMTSGNIVQAKPTAVNLRG